MAEHIIIISPSCQAVSTTRIFWSPGKHKEILYQLNNVNQIPSEDNPCSFILCYSIFMNVLSIHRYWSISRWVKARPPATKVVFPAIFASRSLLGWVLSWLCTMPSSASSPTVVTSRSPGAMNYHGVTDLSTSYRTQAFHKTVISRFIAWERVGTQLNKELKYISMVKHNSNYIKWMMN